MTYSHRNNCISWVVRVCNVAPESKIVLNSSLEKLLPTVI